MIAYTMTLTEFAGYRQRTLFACFQANQPRKNQGLTTNWTRWIS